MEKRAFGEMSEPSPHQAPVRFRQSKDGGEQQRPQVHGDSAANSNNHRPPEKIHRRKSFLKIIYARLEASFMAVRNWATSASVL